MLDPQPLSADISPQGSETKGSLALMRLRRAFICCELVPGSIIAEAELADRFQLGRAGVRAALARLEVEGFVRPAARAGWQVAPVTGASIGDLCRAWRMIGHGLAHTATTSAMASQLLAQAGMADALLGRTEWAVVQARRAMVRDFLLMLGQAAGRLVLSWVRLNLDLADRLIHCFERDHPRLGGTAMTPLARALAAGDPDAAAACFAGWCDHLQAWLGECLTRCDEMVMHFAEASQASAGAAVAPRSIKKPAKGHSNPNRQGTA